MSEPFEDIACERVSLDAADFQNENPKNVKTSVSDDDSNDLTDSDPDSPIIYPESYSTNEVVPAFKANNSTENHNERNGSQRNRKDHYKEFQIPDGIRPWDNDGSIQEPEMKSFESGKHTIFDQMRSAQAG